MVGRARDEMPVSNTQNKEIEKLISKAEHFAGKGDLNKVQSEITKFFDKTPLDSDGKAILGAGLLEFLTSDQLNDWGFSDLVPAPVFNIIDGNDRTVNQIFLTSGTPDLIVWDGVPYGGKIIYGFESGIDKIQVLNAADSYIYGNFDNFGQSGIDDTLYLLEGQLPDGGYGSNNVWFVDYSLQYSDFFI